MAQFVFISIKKLIAVAVTISALTFVSCSSTVKLNSLAEANHKIGSGPAEIHLKSGLVYDGEQLRFGKNTTWFINSKSESFMQIKTQEVEYVYVSHHLGGAVEGLLIGGAAGSVGGLVGGMNISNNNHGGRLLAVIGTGILGGLVGLAVGTAKGHEYMFILPTDTATVNTPEQFEENSQQHNELFDKRDMNN